MSNRSVRIRRLRGKRRGMALLAMVVATFSAVSALAVMLTLASFSNGRADVERRAAEARYLGMGALEAAKKQVIVSVANWQPPPQAGVADIAGHEVDYEVSQTDLDVMRVDGAGILTMIRGFELFAVGDSRGHRQPARRLVNVEATPLFQFAVFYTTDLEIFPGPNMVLNGRVHTNGDLFLGSGNTLTLDTNYVRAVGQMFRHRKDNPGVSDGTVSIRRWVENPFDPGSPSEFVTMYSRSQMQAQGVSTFSGYDSHFTQGVDLDGDGSFFGPGEWLPWAPGALNFWGAPGQSEVPPDLPALAGYTVLDQSHGTTELVVPAMGSIAMFQPSAGGDWVWNETTQRYVPAAPGTGTHGKGFFHDKAELAFIVYADGTWDAFDGQGASVKSEVASAVSQKLIYDARQAGGTGQRTPVFELDMEVLNASGAFPANGLLYASHYGLGQGVKAKGIKLVNGAELAAPLTVVSEGAIYVQGDFNTENKKPAAVMGDAVNLLSNAWNDHKNPNTLPAASDTTYNLAIVTGNHETSVGSYNGGFENLPRFHENWSNRDCRIRGSFVNLWNSRYATGNWVYGGDRYQAPRRLWSYDPLFNNIATLPPYTPMAVHARDIVSW